MVAFSKCADVILMFGCYEVWLCECVVSVCLFCGISCVVIAFLLLLHRIVALLIIYMKTNQLVLELIAAGCVVRRHGKRHDMWMNPLTGGIAMVPRHGSTEISIGTERDIRKRLGVAKRR